MMLDFMNNEHVYMRYLNHRMLYLCLYLLCEYYLTLQWLFGWPSLNL